MSETKHTSGPWIYSKDERYFPRVEFPAARLEGRYLTVNEPTGEVMGVYEANARLIAAAPELLAALECENAIRATPLGYDVLKRHGMTAKDRSPYDFCNRLRAEAIAKATGADHA